MLFVTAMRCLHTLSPTCTITHLHKTYKYPAYCFCFSFVWLSIETCINCPEFVKLHFTFRGMEILQHRHSHRWNPQYSSETWVQLIKCPPVQENHSTRTYMPMWGFWKSVSLRFCLSNIRRCYAPVFVSGPVHSGAFNFSIFKGLLKALHCRTKFQVNTC